jgi:hypothetical protein
MVFKSYEVGIYMSKFSLVVFLGAIGILIFMSFHVWANGEGGVFVNDVGHECYPALAVIDEGGNVNYETGSLYWICYPSLEERLLGHERYYVGGVPDYLIEKVDIVSEVKA